MIRRPPRSTPLSLHDALPIYNLERSTSGNSPQQLHFTQRVAALVFNFNVECKRSIFMFTDQQTADRKSTRLNSSHANISYAVFCLKKKKIKTSTAHSSNTTCR